MRVSGRGIRAEAGLAQVANDRNCLYHPHARPIDIVPPPLAQFSHADEIRIRSRKSDANTLKHGIDFESAQALWDDPDALRFPARATGEPRTLVIGKIGGKHWSAVITLRGDAIRLISVRRSRVEEVLRDESQ
jgi:uncharacterized DUF497 family protein